MPLTLLIVIALVQWAVVMVLPNVNPQYNPTIFLCGNLQIISVIWVYQMFNKYIKF